MAANPEGPLMTVRIDNETRGEVRLSLWLYKTAFGECGYRSFVIDPHSSVTATGMPQGCYFAGAFVSDPKGMTKSFGDGLCMTNGDRWKLGVGPDVIKLE